MKLRFKPYPKPSSIKPGEKPKSRALPAGRRLKPAVKNDDAPLRLKAQPGYVRCVFTLSLREYRILQICMQERGLKPGSYNAALETILQEWKALKEQQHHPALISIPADRLPKNYDLGEE